MNIFALDANPARAAEGHCDKHLTKMIVESSQILSTALRARREFPNDIVMKTTHAHHPCVIWTQQRSLNVLWLNRLLYALLWQADLRFGDRKADGELKHRRSRRLVAIVDENMALFPNGPQTPFALCMPAEFRQPNAVLAYRAYYASKLAKMEMTWTAVPRPAWMPKVAS